MTKLCECGCGLPAPIPPHSNRSKGWVAGEPRPYRSGHNRRRSLRWSEEDRGYETPCWVWQLFVDPETGYGQSYRGNRRGMGKAHRVVYEERVGPVPKGLDLDHLCRVRACVNPEHLEAVTRLENVRRGIEARKKEMST